jgi:hypothetical protein
VFAPSCQRRIFFAFSEGGVQVPGGICRKGSSMKKSGKSPQPAHSPQLYSRAEGPQCTSLSSEGEPFISYVEYLEAKPELGAAGWTLPGAAPASAGIAETGIGSVGTVISKGIVWPIERRRRIFGRGRGRRGAGGQNQTCHDKRYPSCACKQPAPPRGMSISRRILSQYNGLGLVVDGAL